MGKELLLVQLTRVKKESEISPIEHFIGFLTDAYGNAIDAPEIGESIYLGSDDESIPVFKTDRIWRLNTFDGHWEIMTENGTEYIIENQRVYN